MKYLRVNVALIVIALAALVAIVSFVARTSRGQSQGPKSDSRVKPTVLVTNRHGDSAAERAANTSAFAAAAAQNAVLHNELVWTFGGKQQRGWYLYTALINQTLNT